MPGSEEGYQTPHQDLDNVLERSRRWETDFNTRKLSIRNFGENKKRISHYYTLRKKKKKTSMAKDLGVTISNNL